MNTVSVLFWVCFISWLIQFGALIPFLWRLRRPAEQRSDPAEWPTFYISMPLRGADETLERALRCLLDQDYPDFEIRIVVDSDSDSAWPVLRKVIAETGTTRLKPSTLRVRREQCSLLCSSLVQVLEDLEGKEGLLSFCAADMHPPRNWMREMASLMADPSVGATLGNRWYLPPRGQWGSLVQYLWNVGAIVPMAMQEIPWGGALALRLRDVRAAGLDEQWSKGMVEDAPIKSALRKLGLRFQFSPQLFVADRGEISLPRACQFIYRQLLWTRLYHPNWLLVIGNAAWTTGTMLAPFVAAAALAMAGDIRSGWLLLGIGLAYILASAALAGWIDVTVRKVLRDRGEEAASFSPVTWLRACVAIPLTQVIYAGAMVFAGFAREVSWRGIRYRLDGPWSVRMLGYQPYQPTRDQADPTAPAPAGEAAEALDQRVEMTS